jgi:hypothetical protein
LYSEAVAKPSQHTLREKVKRLFHKKRLTTMVIQGTPNQVVQFSGKIGGALRVFEDKVELLVGGFNFDLNDLPEPGAVLPCATPVNCDEATRKIVPLITAKVAAVDSGDATKVTLEKVGLNVPAVKVGMKVAIINDTLTTQYASGAFATIAAIDGDEITLSAALTGLAAGNILVEVVDIDGGKAAIKAVPNRLLPYDVVRDEKAISVDGDGAYSSLAPVLERRCPPITDAITKALADAGCTFVWSNRK